MKLGFGTQAYFDIHVYLIGLFFFLSLLAIPSIYYYTTYASRNTSYSGFFHSISLGNLGFAEPLCKDISLGVGTLSLTCHTGRIMEIVSFGVTPREASILDACMPNEETK